MNFDVEKVRCLHLNHKSFKVGDRVRLTSRIINYSVCDCSNPTMRDSIGQIFIIKDLGKENNMGWCNMTLHNSHWYWCGWWFDPVEEDLLEDIFDIC